MAERAMTMKQRTAVVALEAARAAGVSLVEYAQANGRKRSANRVLAFARSCRG